MSHREQQNNNVPDTPGREMRGGTGSMLQDSADMLIDRGEKAAPVRKKIGKAKQSGRAGK